MNILKLKKSLAPKWRMPTDKELGDEHTWENKHLAAIGNPFPTKEHFLAAAKAGQLVDMPEGVDRATAGGNVESVRSMTSAYQHPRDVDSIVQGLKSGTTFPAPIVVKHAGGLFMMGGNTRQHLASLHGHKAKVLLVDATAPLQKGALRREAPFNPEKDVPSAEVHHAKEWVKQNRPVQRERLPRHEGAIRMRALNKLANHTASRRNPTTGEREFLLHRGMSAIEHNGHVSGELPPTHSSWTPSHDQARQFANDYSDDDGMGTKNPEPGHLASAWIPEKHIHNFPFMLSHDPAIKGYRPEFETVVAPHEYNIISAPTAWDIKAAAREKAWTSGFSLQTTKKLGGKESVRERIQTQMGPKPVTKSLEKAKKLAAPKEVPGLIKIPSGIANGSVGAESAKTPYTGNAASNPSRSGPEPAGTGPFVGSIPHDSANGRGFMSSTPDLVLDSSHLHPSYANHHPDLVDGLKPDEHHGHISEDTITEGVRVGQHTKHNTKVVVKPPLDFEKILDNSGDEGMGTAKHDHFGNPDFTTAHREAAYHKLADGFFGMGKYVPRTTLFNHPNGETHSAQEFIPGTKDFGSMGYGDREDWFRAHVGQHDTERLAIMNTILGNGDRHPGNALYKPTSNTLHLIDHGGTFDYGHAFHNPVPFYQHGLNDTAPATPETHAWVQSLSPKKFQEHLAATGAPPELAAIAVNRLKEVQRWSKKHPTTPAKHGTGLAMLHTLNNQGVPFGPKKVASDRQWVDRRYLERKK